MALSCVEFSSANDVLEVLEGSTKHTSAAWAVLVLDVCGKSIDVQLHIALVSLPEADCHATRPRSLLA